jgi:hypothetical protein
MRPFGTIGLVALAFAAASYQVLEEWNAFNVGNVVVGGALVAMGGVAALQRLRARTTAADRGVTLDAVLAATALVWGAVLLQLFVSAWGVRFDWTFEQRYELAPATRKVLSELGATGTVELTLYTAGGDPRRRATRLLLDEMARGADATVDERDLDESSEEEDYYGIGSSNSVVVIHEGRWQLVERPTEGALFEALSRLKTPSRKVVYVSAGAGEGDLLESSDAGFSGLLAALETEGYEARRLPTGIHASVPSDANLLLIVAPERRLTNSALRGIRRYLDEGGGRLVALLEPGRESGIEELLAAYGLTSPDAIVIDPASGPVEGDAAGLNPIAAAYADHPVSRELDANRMTFFRHARSFTLRKPQPGDGVHAAVYTSPEAWLHEDTSSLSRKRTPERPPGVRGNYLPLVVAGKYERGGKQARVVAFGDSTFASNRYLRALFNLDLVMNAVHWATEREPDITLRPKSGALLQFPIPIQNALNALYGIGLLIPELLVMTGAWVWLRRRAA